MFFTLLIPLRMRLGVSNTSSYSEFRQFYFTQSDLFCSGAETCVFLSVWCDSYVVRTTTSYLIRAAHILESRIYKRLNS